MASPQGPERGPFAQRWPARADEKLDRGLVAGLLLEVVLDNPGAPQEPQAHRTFVRTRLKNTLVSHLAGLVSLDRFRTLMAHLDHWFALYYPLVSRALPPAPGHGPKSEEPPPSAPHPIGILRDEPLKDWRQAFPTLLPSRPHRKLTWARLREFLEKSRGGWFGVRDFARHLALDRKTAWEYLQKLQGAGLLRHNRARSAAARYCLASPFLRVRSDSLRQRVA
jgi:hypothetical protein